jgi:NAD(P)-dependent dehydrogenase (short-subunit alcohol dehydrogenase family)
VVLAGRVQPIHPNRRPVESRLQLVEGLRIDRLVDLHRPEHAILLEVAADGILINCVAPGIVDTDLIRNLPPEQLQTLCEQIPLKRVARTEEVAALIAFLASDECSYCTGATFDINGGWLML